MIADRNQIDQMDQMQRELARIERHIRIYTICAMRFPVTTEGCWPDYELAPGKVTTGFLPMPGSEHAADLTTADLDRIEGQVLR